MIKLQDFAREQGVTDRQIQRLLKKYETEMVGHFERRGVNGTWIDDVGCAILRSKMKVKEIVVADEAMINKIKELEEKLERKDVIIERLQQREQEKDLLIEKMRSEQLVIEEKSQQQEKEKEEAQKQAAAQAEEAKIQSERADAAERKIAEVEQAFAAEQQRPLSLMERLTGKRRSER